MPLIHSNDSWTRLREVWLGDVYPAHFYDHLAPEIRDVFYQITEWTQEDLKIIEKKLKEFDVVVRRPQYQSIDDHLDHREQLIKPEITPRDFYVTVGNTLYVPQWKSHGLHGYVCPWRDTLSEYSIDSDSRVEYFDCQLHISGANMVRVGKDLYLDCCYTDDSTFERTKKQIFEEDVIPMFSDRRVHFLDNGGHMDGCFAILKPGVIIANNYFDDYERTFPGWEVIMLSQPEFWKHCPTAPSEIDITGNRGWWLPESVGNRSFNEHVLKFAQDWVGNYRETYFEVNCLVIDEKNVLMLGENEAVFQKLSSLGITAHCLPFRCRTFWDGGLHCLTVDIRREGPIEDFFSNRNSCS